MTVVAIVVSTPRISPFQAHNSQIHEWDDHWNRNAVDPAAPGSSSKASPRGEQQSQIRESCPDQPWSLDQNLQHERCPRCRRGRSPVSSISGEGRQGRWTYPFEISMDDPELMEVGHSGHDIRKLKVIEEMSLGGSKQAHQLQTICLWVVSCVLHHVPVRHPL